MLQLIVLIQWMFRVTQRSVYQKLSQNKGRIIPPKYSHMLLLQPSAPESAHKIRRCLKIFLKNNITLLNSTKMKCYNSLWFGHYSDRAKTLREKLNPKSHSGLFYYYFQLISWKPKPSNIFFFNRVQRKCMIFIYSRIVNYYQQTLSSKQIFILEWRSEQIYLLSQVTGLSNTY